MFTGSRLVALVCERSRCLTFVLFWGGGCKYQFVQDDVIILKTDLNVGFNVETLSIIWHGGFSNSETEIIQCHSPCSSNIGL